MNAVAAPLLVAQGLTKHFEIASGIFNRQPRVVHALDDVCLEIGPGETLALVGESGSGKTTTGRLILRLIEPTAGTVRFDGRDIFSLRGDELRRFRKDVQVIFQDPRASLNPRKTVLSILRDPLLLHGLAPRKGMRASVAESLERVGLSPAYRFLDRNPLEFSGGQLQRICIARAVSLHPRLIVADEAVSALDISVRAQILQLLEQLQRESGLSYLFITHDLAVVRSIANRVAVMYLGQIVEMGQVEDVFAQPAHPYTRALLSAAPVPKPRQARQRERIVLHGEIPSSVSPPAGCRFHTRCPLAMPICESVAPTWQALAATHQVACHLFDPPA